jgi:hypothetical protein
MDCNCQKLVCIDRQLEAFNFTYLLLNYTQAVLKPVCIFSGLEHICVHADRGLLHGGWLAWLATTTSLAPAAAVQPQWVLMTLQSSFLLLPCPRIPTLLSHGWRARLKLPERRDSVVALRLGGAEGVVVERRRAWLV